MNGDLPCLFPTKRNSASLANYVVPLKELEQIRIGQVQEGRVKVIAQRTSLTTMTSAFVL